MKDLTEQEKVIDAYEEGEISVEDVIQWFKDNLNIVYVHTEDSDEFIPVDEAQKDDDSGEYYSHEAEFVEVYNNKNNFNAFIMCEGKNAEDIAFYCVHSDHFWHDSIFEKIEVEGDTVCYQFCDHEGLLYWWESDDEYHWSEEEYDDENHSDIPQYHTQYRPPAWQEVKGLGVELEIFSEERKNLYDCLPTGIIGETDGSLHEDYGIELIGAPFEYEKYKNHETPWTEAIKTAVDMGAKSGQNGYRTEYGMHVSVSRKLFTDFIAAKFIVFMNMQSDLCKLIAQRDTIFSGDYHKRKNTKQCICYEDEFGYTRATKNLKYHKRTLKTDKYEAVSAAKNRLEVRIFRSTVDYNSFLKNVEFVEAVRQWTAQKTTTAKIVSRNQITDKFPTGTSLFFEWLNDQDDYNNLKQYLIRKAPENVHIIGIDKVKV